MTITVEYIGDLDPKRAARIVAAFGPGTHTSTYYGYKQTHVIVFMDADQAAFDRIKNSGLEFSKLESA